MPSPKHCVLFFSGHNTGRNQGPEAHLWHFAGDAIEVGSAGTILVEAR
jgi:protein-tyrosine-phosphatase